MSTETLKTHTVVEAGTAEARALSRITRSTFWVVVPELRDEVTFNAFRTKAVALEYQKDEATTYAVGSCVGRCGGHCGNCGTPDDFIDQFPIAKIYLASDGSEHFDSWSDAFDRAVDLKDPYWDWASAWSDVRFRGRFIVVIDPVAGDGREILEFASRHPLVVRAIGNGITISMLASA